VFVRGLAEHSPAVNNPDGIFVDASYGDDETWHLFDHEIAHEYDTSELRAQIDVDSETARAYREWVSVAAGRMLDDATLAEEIVADILSGRTDLLIGRDLLDAVRDAEAFSKGVQSFERMRSPQTRFATKRQSRRIPPPLPLPPSPDRAAATIPATVAAQSSPATEAWDNLQSFEDFIDAIETSMRAYDEERVGSAIRVTQAIEQDAARRAIEQERVKARAIPPKVRAQIAERQRTKLEKYAARKGLKIKADELPETWQGIVTAATKMGAAVEREKGRMVSTEYAVDRAIRAITKESGTREESFIAQAYDHLDHLLSLIEPSADGKYLGLRGDARSTAIAQGIAEALRPEDAYLILRASNHNADRALGAVRKELEARGRTLFRRGIEKFIETYSPTGDVPNPKLENLTTEGREQMRDWLTEARRLNLYAEPPNVLYHTLIRAQTIKALSDSTQKMIVRGQTLNAERLSDAMREELKKHRPESKADAEGRPPKTTGMRGAYTHTSTTMTLNAYGGRGTMGWELQHEALWQGENDYKLDYETAQRNLNDFMKSLGYGVLQRVMMRIHAKPVRIGDRIYHMTDAQRIHFAAMYRRYIARVHILRDGWKLTDMVGGTHVIRGESPEQSESMAHDVLATITENEAKIVAKMGELQIDVVRKINEMGNRLFGRNLMNETDYILGMTPELLNRKPVEAVDLDGWSSQGGNRTLENAGVLKLPVNHTHALVIGDAFMAFERHSDAIARIANLTEPLRRLRQTLNASSSQLRRDLADRLGIDYVTYLDETMAALAGHREFTPYDKTLRMISRLVGNVARSLIYMNPTTYMRNIGPGTAAFQTWLINEHPKAAAYFSITAPVPRSLHFGSGREIIEFAEKHNGFFAHRFKQSAEIIMAPMKNAPITTRSRLAASLAWKGITRLLPLNPVNAEKRIVIAGVRALMRSGMTMQQAVDAAARGIDATQNSTSDLSETAFIRHMRARDIGGIAAFMSQSVVMGNLFSQYAAERRWGGAAVAALGILAAHAISFAITYGDRWLRRPDDEREKERRKLIALASEVSNLVSMVAPDKALLIDPLLSAAFGMGQGGDITLIGRPLTMMLGGVGSIVNRLVRGKEPTDKMVENVLSSSAAILTGAPVTGARRMYEYATVGAPKIEDAVEGVDPVDRRNMKPYTSGAVRTPRQMPRPYRPPQQ
jgi:hypothetical protein